eukprot:1160297-Pelagomonas_calceolata.AAC.7
MLAHASMHERTQAHMAASLEAPWWSGSDIQKVKERHPCSAGIPYTHLHMSRVQAHMPARVCTKVGRH